MTNLRKDLRSACRIYWRSAAVLAGAGALSACAAGPSVEPGPVPAAGTDANGAPTQPWGMVGQDTEQGPVRVAPLDTISVTVMREPDLTRESVLVDENGNFMLPMVGEVKAAGHTTAEIAEYIRARLAANYLVNPVVSVNMTELAQRIVTIEGAVKDPGQFELTPGTTLLGAIALADGPAVNTAKLSDIAVFRKVDGQQMAAVYDLKQIRAGQSGDPLILPGDRVVVGFSAVGEGLENALRAIPVLGVFTRI